MADRARSDLFRRAARPFAAFYPGGIAAILPVPPEARHDRSSPAFIALRDDVLRRLGVSGTEP